MLVFDASDGELLHALKGHRGAVYCVAYAWDGRRFASGGADKAVIVWTSRGEGVLRYAHGDAIQTLAYNPATHQLASGTASDLGLWSPEQKAVTKHRVAARVLCSAWTLDGALLALGCQDGSVSVRDRGGAERVRFSAGGGGGGDGSSSSGGGTPAAVWSVAWAPTRDQPVLAVACLDGRLRFFTAGGAQRHRDRRIDGARRPLF